jgi:hypothetical protein
MLPHSGMASCLITRMDFSTIHDSAVWVPREATRDCEQPLRPQQLPGLPAQLYESGPSVYADALILL